MASTSSGEVQRFCMFTDSLYTFHHRSSKNTYELRKVAEEMCIHLSKVSPVFTVRWVASSFRAVKSFASGYSALYSHLLWASQDRRRSSQERSKCAGLAKKMNSWSFVAEMLLLYDVLEVLWHLSSYLQTRTASLIDAQSRINVAIKTLSAMKSQAGLHLEELVKSPVEVEYSGVKLTRTKCDVQVQLHNMDNL